MHPTEDELRNFLQEPVDGATSAGIDGHLTQCADCRERVENMIDMTFGQYVSASNSSLAKSTLAKSTLAKSTPAKSTLANQVSVETVSSTANTSPLDFGVAAVQDGIGLRFVVLDQIASGGMGAVYRAYDRELKREIAIKVSTAAQSKVSEHRFHREAQISAQLEHPSIVPVHETGRLKDGRQYIAMKLVKGQTLSSVIKQSLESKQPVHLVQMFDDICNAMALAHSCEIIHRDLKPDNVMVGMFGEVQIMDWGLARKLDDNKEPESQHSAKALSLRATRQGAVFGTPAYISPEQARGDQADKRTDVFALGGILYQILCGKPPFDSPTATVALAKSADNDLADVFNALDESEADEALIALAKRCLAPNPDHRPADAQSVSQDLKEYIRGRERRFEEARLEKARATERLLAQQKQNVHTRRFFAAIFAVLLGVGVLGFMYLKEKNTRLANESSAKQEQLKRAVLAESTVRASISAAQIYAERATTKLPHEQIEDWTLAQKEADKARPFVSDAIEPELKRQFEKLASQIHAESLAATKSKQDYNVEVACATELMPLREHSYYPEDMRLSKLVDLMPQLQAVYARLGVEPGVISHQGVARIASSEFRTEFIHGLMVWIREVSTYLSYNDLHLSEVPELKQTYQWLQRFIDRVDPDPFRTQMRQVEWGIEERHVTFAQTYEATSSVLTVYTCIEALQWDTVSSNERAEFLLRANQKYPKDFFISWALPVMSHSKERQAYALACYSLRPDNPAVLTALGFELINANKPNRAIEPLQKLTEIAPWYYLGHRNLGLAYSMLGEKDKASICFAKAKDALVPLRDRFMQRAKYFRSINRLSKARAIEAIFDYETQNTPHQREKNTTLSVEAIEKRQKLRSAILRQIERIKQEPDYQAHYGKLAKLYESLCELLTDANRPDLVTETVDAAVTDFREVAELTNEIATPHERLCAICEQHGRFETAIDALKKAIEILPDYRQHKDHLIKLYDGMCEQHRDDQRSDLYVRTIDNALEDMDEFSLQSPAEDDFFHKRMSQFAERNQRYERAAIGYQRALKVHPDYTPFRAKQGEMYILAGRHQLALGYPDKADDALDKAIALFRAWVAESPADSIPHERLSEACEVRGFFSEAIEHLEIAIGIHPDYQPHHDRYAKLAVLFGNEDQTDLSIRIETLSNTITLLNEISPNHDRLTRPHDLLSRLSAQTGDYHQAIRSLQYVTQKYPRDHFLRERLAQLYVRNQQNDRAEAILVKLHNSNQGSKRAVAMLAKFYIDHNQLSKAESLLQQSFSKGVSSQELKTLASAADGN